MTAAPAEPQRAELRPKISVITVVRNAVEVLPRTLESVLGQDYPNLEYLVIDGQSTDGTVVLLDRYRRRIDKVVSERDGGIYEAMNKGARLATGEWVLFMNAGDLFVDGNVITRAVDSMDWRGCDVVYGDGIMCHEGYRVVERAPDRVTLGDGNGFSHQSTFVRATVQREYEFDATERIAADYDLFLRLYKSGKVFRRVDVVVSEFFTGGMSSLPLLETIRLRHRVYKKHFPRSDLVLYGRLISRWLKIQGRRVMPASLWTGLKKMRDRNRLLPEVSR